ncbi:hypothetical protein ACI65C_004032 [Semiaphis heraclei]
MVVKKVSAVEKQTLQHQTVTQHKVVTPRLDDDLYGHIRNGTSTENILSNSPGRLEGPSRRRQPLIRCRSSRTGCFYSSEQELTPGNRMFDFTPSDRDFFGNFLDMDLALENAKISSVPFIQETRSVRALMLGRRRDNYATITNNQLSPAVAVRENNKK